VSESSPASISNTHQSTTPVSPSPDDREVKTGWHRPNGVVLGGWIVSTLVLLFNLFDGLAKMFNAKEAIDGSDSLGFPVKYLFAIGLTLIVCSIVYMVPFTSLVGAVLLTGYLGGATAIQVRVESSNFLFALFIGLLAWVGLLMRDARLRAFVRESLIG
jgi:hypothetical protein